MPEPGSDTLQGTCEATFVTEALHAEAQAIAGVAARLEDEATAGAWRTAIDLLESCEGHVVVSGMGKSGLIGAKLSATFSSLGQPSHVLHPSEAIHGDLGSLRRDDVVLLLSHSGDTDEVCDLAAILRADDIPRLGISASGTSRLADLCTVHLSLGPITEACPLNLAPTASTAAMLAVGDALALAVSRRRNFDANDFHRVHPGGMLGAGLRRVTEALRFRAGENLPVLPETMSLGEALRAARPEPRADGRPGRRAGAILLIDDAKRLAGIFTDGDLRRLVVDEDMALDRPIREVMTSSPRHLTTESLVRDARQLVTDHRVDEIPVVDDEGRPVGLLDIQDLIAPRVVRD